jgi:hypothetical protein
MTIASCKKPYMPTTTATGKHYLVVEGTITGGDSTIIKLSRTADVAETGNESIRPEASAMVTVEDDQNITYTLSSRNNGTYISAPLNLDNTRQYRLRIQTSDGGIYRSAFVPVKTTPPIDSVGYTAKSTGLQVYVNTHDAANSSRYYRWDFEETWQFHAMYISDWVSNGQELLQRNSDQQVYYCYNHDVSSTINLGSTAKLKENVIYQNPVSFIPSTSEKVETKYSILVKQYSLTPEAYSFYENLKKNTESLGSIFDALPSELRGNIHNINDASEPVLGYISAGNVQTKRIFISNADLPPDWRPKYPYEGCHMDSTLFGSDPNGGVGLLIPLPPSALALYKIKTKTDAGYMTSTIECSDCTIRGTTTKPDFWK